MLPAVLTLSADSEFPARLRVPGLLPLSCSGRAGGQRSEIGGVRRRPIITPTGPAAPRSGDPVTSASVRDPHDPESDFSAVSELRMQVHLLAAQQVDLQSAFNLQSFPSRTCRKCQDLSANQRLSNPSAAAREGQDTEETSTHEGCVKKTNDNNCTRKHIIIINLQDVKFGRAQQLLVNIVLLLSITEIIFKCIFFHSQVLDYYHYLLYLSFLRGEIIIIII